jgi:hypothetical protein
LGLSRNKVAVSEGAAGSPPFYGEHGRGTLLRVRSYRNSKWILKQVMHYLVLKDQFGFGSFETKFKLLGVVEMSCPAPTWNGPIAQLVRAHP